ncbi:MAG: NAD(P)-binding protein, partial [Longimicrobiales bacterium]
MSVAITSSYLLPGEVAAFSKLLQQERQQQEYYPPTLTGMRGTHAGAFEVGHALRDGARFDNASDTGERYDMVVVGAGLSGLASAYFFHTAAGRNSRVLVLDNHDDFGGHAKRNEFWHDGKMVLLNGGTSNMEAIDHYSTVSRTLMKAIGIDFARLEAASDMTGEYCEENGHRIGSIMKNPDLGKT